MADSQINPIFLVGCPRSGTTLLQQILDSHPNIAIAPETFFIRNFWLNRNYYGDLQLEKNYHKLLNDISSIPEFEEMGLDKEFFHASAKKIQRDYSSVFRLLLQQFAKSRGVTLVGEKTPNHLLYMPILKQFFPLAKFVHIVRDPRSVAQSWQKVPWSTGSLSGDAAVWQRYLRTARQSTASLNESMFTLHYEELVTDPSVVLNKLCLFLQIQFSPEMLLFYQNPSTTVNTDREPWKLNAKNQLTKTSLNRWQSELSRVEIFEIEKKVWSEMKYFGYSPVSKVQILAISSAFEFVQHKLKRSIKRVQFYIPWLQKK